MNCPKCKKEIDEDSKFCQFCGKKLGKGYAEIVDKILKGGQDEMLIARKRKFKWEIVLIIISALLLLIASFDGGDNTSGGKWGSSNSDFYTFLRVYVFIISSYFAYYNFKANKIGIVFLFAALAILFNPLKPIVFSADFWSVIDFFSSIFFFFYGYLIIHKYRKIKTQKI